jgi:transposase
LASVPGIGPIIATALAATWLGLVPRQHSTGGKARLSGICKRGNRYTCGVC